MFNKNTLYIRWWVIIENKGEIAVQLFLSGLNCAQAVFCAYCNEVGISHAQAARLASGFGGGIGRLRGTCGAVSGMVMVLGALHGYDDPLAKDDKTNIYKIIQNAVKRFEQENRSIICSELLSLSKKQIAAETPQASERTSAYYKERPCANYCRVAAEIIQSTL